MVLKRLTKYLLLAILLHIGGNYCYAQTSPFAEGYWVKIPIKESGVYELPFDTLRAWGFDDPEHISVYGISRRDFSFKEDTIRKMQEIPLQIHVSETSQFYSVYLEGVIRNEYSNDIKFTNPYNSKQSAYYYYIKQNASDTPPLSIDTLNLNNGTDSLYWDFGYNAYTHLIDNEAGYSLDSQAYVFLPKIDYLDFEYKLDSLLIDVQNTISVTVQCPAGTDADTFYVCINDSLHYEAPISNFDQTTRYIEPPYLGAIDKIEIFAKQGSSLMALKEIDISVFIPYKYIYAPFYLCQLSTVYATQRYGIRIAYDEEFPIVLSLKDRLIATIVKPKIEDGELILSDVFFTDDDFYIYNPNKLLEIDTLISVPKIDLLNLEPCEYLVITADSLYDEGVRLAQLHQEYDNLSTQVVRVSDIYNLYTGGRIFAEGIYHFCKQVYNKGEVSGNSLKYVVLLGEGSEVSWYFDEKYNIPVSVPEYCGDAFAGVFEDTLTYPKAIMYKSTMNVAVGRIPARNAQEAEIYIDKVEARYKSLTKSNLEDLFIADQYDERIELSFIDDLEPFAVQLHDNQLENIIHKEYWDDSLKSDETENNIISYINSGVGVVCYYGHSNYNGWNHSVLATEKIMHLENEYFPLIFSASCNYAPIGVYDDCAAYSWLFNSNGGAIAVIGFTKETGIDTAKEYLKCFQDAFVNNEDCSFGEQYRIAWNCYSGIWKRLVYLGDPAVWAHKPKNTISLTKGIDNEILGQIDNSNFDEGLASIKVYNQSTLNATIAKKPELFSVSDSVIYSSNADITDGKFNFSLPDAISNGSEDQVHVYAISKDSTIEALGTAKLSSMINNTPSATEIDVFPIPFSSQLNIRSECLVGESVRIFIYGVDGKLVCDKLESACNGKIIITTERLSSGYYVLVIQSDANTSMHNIIKVE